MSNDTRENQTDDDLAVLAKTFQLLKPFFSLKIGSMLGMLIVFWYCFFYIQYLPTGLDLSANILFAFMALAVGFIYIILVIFPALISGVGMALLTETCQPSKLWQDAQNEKIKCFPKVYFLLIGGFICCLYFNLLWLVCILLIINIIYLFYVSYNLYVAVGNNESCWENIKNIFNRGNIKNIFKNIWINISLENIFLCCAYLLTVFAALVFIWCLHDNLGLKISITISAALFWFALFLLINANSDNLQHSKHHIPTISSFFIIVSIFLNAPFLFSQENISSSFEQMGLRQVDVAVQLVDADYEKIKQIAQQENLNILFNCDNQKNVHGINVLWHGIGSQTLIGLPKSNHENIKLQIKSENLSIVNGLTKGCATLVLSGIFKRGQHTIIDDKKEETNEKINKFVDVYLNDSNKERELEKVEIIGFSDKTEFNFKRTLNSNEKLAKLRASTIKDLLSANGKIKDKIRPVRSMGSKYAVEKCDGIKNKEDLEHCQRADRKVEIKLYFKK